MKRDNTSGILIIVSGAWGILSAMMSVFMSIVFPRMMGPGGEFVFPDAFWAFYLIMGIAYFLLGIAAIIGGVFAIRRNSWRWALAGAIASIFTFFPTGIVALIYLFKIQNEFSKT